jgi:hypothetical protein
MVRIHRKNPIVFAALVLWAASATMPSAAPNDKEAIALQTRARELTRAEKYADAIPLVQRALAIQEKVSGPDDPGVAFLLDDLAGLYEDQSRYILTPSRSTGARWRSVRKCSAPTNPKSRQR